MVGEWRNLGDHMAFRGNIGGSVVLTKYKGGGLWKLDRSRRH